MTVEEKHTGRAKLTAVLQLDFADCSPLAESLPATGNYLRLVALILYSARQKTGRGLEHKGIAQA